MAIIIYQTYIMIPCGDDKIHNEHLARIDALTPSIILIHQHVVIERRGHLYQTYIMSSYNMRSNLHNEHVVIGRTSAVITNLHNEVAPPQPSQPPCLLAVSRLAEPRRLIATLVSARAPVIIKLT